MLLICIPYMYIYTHKGKSFSCYLQIRAKLASITDCSESITYEYKQHGSADTEPNNQDTTRIINRIFWTGSRMRYSNQFSQHTSGAVTWEDRLK